jgi:hypothetical protein
MGFRSVKQIIEECYDEGRNCEVFLRKVPSIASTAGIWSDLSGAPGTPKANYFTGLELTSTRFRPADGAWHGGDVSPATKHLHKALFGSASAGHAPGSKIVCDYLLYYPLIDMDSTDEQFFNNTIGLPNYTDGVGVRMFVVATNPYVGGQIFVVKYIDTNDVERSAEFAISNSATLIGTIINSGPPSGVSGASGAFLSTPGARGVKRVVSIQFFGPNGGLAALVLVKPLTTLGSNEITAFTEVDFLTTKPSLPRIFDGAYIGMIGLSGASWAAAPFTVVLDVIWTQD